jgi:hypothetical protein
LDPPLLFEPRRHEDFDLGNKTSALVEQHEKHVVSYEHPRLGFAITSPRRSFMGEAVHRRRPGSLHHLAFRAASAAEVDRLHSQVRETGATIVSAPEGIKYEIVSTGERSE